MSSSQTAEPVPMTFAALSGSGLYGRRAECESVDQLLADVRARRGQAMVLRGEAGAGKTALLNYLAGQAARAGCLVTRLAGVQSEMNWSFAGLHQLCKQLLAGPRLGGAERLPATQRDALRITLGYSAGPPPDQRLLGRAVLSVLSGAAGDRPLVCLVDDAQWLDRASARVLGLIARRLDLEQVGLVFAARDPGAELAGLPELVIGRLGDDDARALLAAALPGPLDARVRDLIISEARGNPLALLELPRGLRQAEMAGGYGLPGAVALAGPVEDNFVRQLKALPAQTQRLVRLAAADLSGDPSLARRAARWLGIPDQAGIPAGEAGLVEFGAQVRFRRPSARSAAYRSASPRERRQLHEALAEATDPVTDPDRRAWHRAQAATGPDDEVAAELERCAGTAEVRGGLAAAAAFLGRAVALTTNPALHTGRILAAARACLRAGDFRQALELLFTAQAGPLNEVARAQAELLRGQIAFASGSASDAPAADQGDQAA